MRLCHNRPEAAPWRAECEAAQALLAGRPAVATKFEPLGCLTEPMGSIAQAHPAHNSLRQTRLLAAVARSRWPALAAEKGRVSPSRAARLPRATAPQKARSAYENSRQEIETSAEGELLDSVLPGD